MTCYVRRKKVVLFSQVVNRTAWIQMVGLDVLRYNRLAR
jgi:hypothetical protein